MSRCGDRFFRPGVALACALTLLASACAPAWQPRTAIPTTALQWPYAPSRAKLTYVRSLSGIARGKSAGSVLRSLIAGGDSGERTAFVLPVAVAIGADERIAVADMGRSCVHLYIPETQRYVQVSGTKQDALRTPVAVVFDDRLQLYVSDSSGKVVVFDANGKWLYSLRAAGPETFQRPTGLAWNAQAKRLYVVDTLASKVHVFGPEGAYVFSFGGRGDTPGLFNFPTHVAWTAAGQLYVTDSLNFRVQIFDERGKPLAAFGHQGDGSGDLGMPKGVAVDRDGIVYVVDSLFDNVQLFNRQGDFLLTLGQRGRDFGEFWLPSGAFISDKDELYVCDTYNRRISVFRISDKYGDDAS